MALLGAGCGSNNTGKIVGKWKVVSAPKEDLDELKELGVTIAFDFKADGTFAVDFVPDNEGHGAKEAADVANTARQGKELSGKYNLGFGDQVYISKGSIGTRRMKECILVTISGDKMTMKVEDETIELERMK